LKLFSQRKGLKPIRKLIQSESMDDDLRNRLWNALTLYYWNKVRTPWLYESGNEDIFALFKLIWHNYFRHPLDTLDMYWEDTRKEIREYFLERSQWNEVYDFLEFIANNYPDKEVNQKFMDFCNSVLENEVSAYRFVGGKITQITSEGEI